MGNRLVFTPKGVAQPSPGSRSAPWGARVAPDLYPAGVAQGRACLVQPLRGRSAWGRLRPRVRCATLGWVVQRLRREDETPCCSIMRQGLLHCLAGTVEQPFQRFLTLAGAGLGL